MEMNSLNPGAYCSESCWKEAEDARKYISLREQAVQGGTAKQDMGQRRRGMKPDEKRHTALFQTKSLQKEDMLYRLRRSLRVNHFIQMIARIMKPHNQATYPTIKFYLILF